MALNQPNRGWKLYFLNLVRTSLTKIHVVNFTLTNWITDSLLNMLCNTIGQQIGLQVDLITQLNASNTLTLQLRCYMWPTHCTDDSSGWLLSAWSAHDWYSIDSMTSSCEVTINQHWVLHFIVIVVASSSSNQKINYHTAPTHLKCWLGLIYMITRLL